MNISVYWSKTIVVTLLLLCAYALSVTINHVAQTLIALALGDNTAEKEGWLTFNPLEHIDPIGIIILLFTNFAWVTRVPFNELAIRNPYRTLKLLVFYLSQPLISCLLALITLTLLVIWFGPLALTPAFALFLSSSRDISLAHFAILYPSHSSLSIIGALFLMALVVYNLFITVVSLISNALRLVFVKLQEYGYIQEYSYTSLWLATFLILILYSGPLYSFLLNMLIQASFIIGRVV